ncbi:MAG: type II toxin-antitoxin system RelE/ParE family toxin [Candidatus Beckwithbacteria bacterium]|nr:type II toxin-antitoxin system RelE/ParE family toxin [Patescibacteria group bacterium]
MSYLHRMHKITYSRSGAKFIRKSKKNSRLLDKLRKINKNLEVDWKKLGAKKLSGELNYIYSYSFRVRKVDYRVAFSIQGQEIYVWLVETRENFYKQLLRKFK